MNIVCVICSELFKSSDDVHVTPCGHMFHYVCLSQWLERSKSCPQCRSKCDRRTHKVYFNIGNFDNSQIDISIIQDQLDNANLKIREKEQESKKAEEEIKSLKAARKKSIKTITGLETELAQKNFLIFSFKEQIKMLKTDNKVIEDQNKEISQLKSKIELMSTIKDVLTANESDVEKLIKEETRVETLCNCVVALKRELRICNTKKSEIRNSLTTAQYDLRKAQSTKKLLEDKIAFLESENCRMVDLMKFQEGQSVVNDKSILNQAIHQSPSISERIKKIEESNSPYLNIKTSSVGLAPLMKFSESCSRRKEETVKRQGGVLQRTTSDINEKYSIFKKPRVDMRTAILKNTNMRFNGFGGSERDMGALDIAEPSGSCEFKVMSSLKQRLKSGKLKKFPSAGTENIEKFGSKN